MRGGVHGACRRMFPLALCKSGRGTIATMTTPRRRRRHAASRQVFRCERGEPGGQHPRRQFTTKQQHARVRQPKWPICGCVCVTLRLIPPASSHVPRTRVYTQWPGARSVRAAKPTGPGCLALAATGLLGGEPIRCHDNVCAICVHVRELLFCMTVWCKVEQWATAAPAITARQLNSQRLRVDGRPARRSTPSWTTLQSLRRRRSAIPWAGRCRTTCALAG